MATDSRWVWLTGLGDEYVLAFCYLDPSAGPSAKGDVVARPPTLAQIRAVVDFPNKTVREPERFGLPKARPMWLAPPLVELVPFCPEDYRLGTPRTMPDLHGGDGYDVLDGKARVLDENREDLTERVLEGARATLGPSNCCTPSSSTSDRLADREAAVVSATRVPGRSRARSRGRGGRG